MVVLQEYCFFSHSIHYSDHEQFMLLVTGREGTTQTNRVQVSNSRGHFCQNHGIPLPPSGRVGAQAVVVDGDKVYLAGGKRDYTGSSTGKLSQINGKTQSIAQSSK